MLFFLSLIGVLLSASGVALAHFRVTSPALGFGIFAAGIGLLGFLFFPAAVALWRKGKEGTSFTSLLLGVPALGLIGFGLVMGSKHPINDLTTDVENPPLFTYRTIDLPLSEEDKALLDDSYALNKSYNKAKAVIQLQKYPDLTFFDVKAPMEKVLPIMAGRLKEQLPDWKIVVNEPSKGRIEAEIESKLFRFVDDVVIEVRKGANPFDSQLHMRSRSRVGEGDLGANYRRLVDLKLRLELAVAPAVEEDAKRRQAIEDAAREKAEREAAEALKKKQELEATLKQGSNIVSPPPPPPPKPAVPLLPPKPKYEGK